MAKEKKTKTDSKVMLGDNLKSLTVSEYLKADEIQGFKWNLFSCQMRKINVTGIQFI